MALSNDLISQFVKTTVEEKKSPQESIVYGTIVMVDGVAWAKLDGSDLLTPISTTSDVKDDERVTVMIKDHTAVVTGNMTSPSASSADVADVKESIVEFEEVTTDRLIASEAIITELQADNVEVKGRLTATEAEISYLEAEKLSAEVAELTYATIDDLDATNADIYNLNATHAKFEEATAKNFEAENAKIDNLKTVYANIDFANIGEAAIKKLFAGTGLIKDLVVGDQTITGELVGVTISGDLIKGNTVMADKLVIKGSDGLYYKLNIDALGETTAEQMPAEEQEALQNGLHGTAIIAKSVTADKISVSDLVAFGATIGGFHITENDLHSGVKESIDNTTQGAYLGADGQMAIGDSNNYLKYYKNADDKYVLEIAAESILFGASGNSLATEIDDLNGATDDLSSEIEDAEGRLDTVESDVQTLQKRTEYIHMGTRVNEDGNEEPCLELGEGDSEFKMIITNTRILFMEGSSTPAYITNQSLHIGKAVVEEELQQGEFVWKARANGNLGLVWKGGTS